MTIRVIHGDCLAELAKLPAGSVQTCVTSPPYLGLRNFEVSGQIGLEASSDAFVAALVAVFGEVRRVLRDDATLWLNLGDGYASGSNPPPGSKPKDLLMVPARVALALQADGWWLRSDVIWHKPNPMPESVTDRPSSCHEHVFLLTKGQRYFYDGDAVREAYSEASLSRYDHVMMSTAPGARKPGGDVERRVREQRFQQPNPNGRNMRNVWTIPTTNYRGAHFATFPPDLAARCIKAGTSERGCCPACGAPWRRIVTKGEPDHAHRLASGADRSGGYNGQSVKGHDAAGVQNASDVKRRILAGMRERLSRWEAGCACPAADPVPCTVLDPFGGAGTTGLVADRLGRDAVLIELNEGYCAMARDRITADGPLFAAVS